jgi:magnesium-protoporphyrin O-methyltransferase
MNCCQCQGIERFFDDKVAARELKDYRRKGPGKTTRWLIEALVAEGVAGKTLLDIGGGVGVIQHELLQAGAGSATNVDASSAYLNAARQEAERRGYVERVNYHFGNFVELASQIEPVDIVTLDRVICCYHDMIALVGLSAARAGALYGVVYPRATWWMKLGVKIINNVSWLTRNPFRIFVHPTPAVEAVIHANGLKQRFHRQTLLWQVVVYGR